MLSDLTINLSQLILHKQFPLINGLEDTEFGLHNKFKIQSGEFIQILYSQSHWVVASSIDESNTIYLYDSMAINSSKVTLRQKKLFRQICLLRATQYATLRIVAPGIQQQPNGIDCGVYAIANAVELCFNPTVDMTTIKFDHKLLRKHLMECIKIESFSPFPKTSKRVAIGKNNDVELDIYCSAVIPFLQLILKKTKENL